MCIHLIETEKALTISNFLKKMQKRNEEDEVILILDSTVNFKLQFSSVAQSCLTLCDPMNHSTPGFPVHHQLPEFTQTHVHRVRDTILPPHPPLSPSPALSLSQHQGLFQ